MKETVVVVYILTKCGNLFQSYKVATKNFWLSTCFLMKNLFYIIQIYKLVSHIFDLLLGSMHKLLSYIYMLITNTYMLVRGIYETLRIKK